ncbi:MAG: isoprenyl transferase [Ruminococcus sp.]|nr:isoprenyl transferase [Ruminococcus sp.]
MSENIALNVPVHVGIIMDGNGRWAKKRLMPRKMGHREGAKTFRTITRACKNMGIKYVTYYAFSTENWARPQDEVDAIMDLFEKYLDDVKSFADENIRIRFIGDRSKLTPSLQQKMADVEKFCEKFDSLDCFLAINYGGRDEIKHSVQEIAKKVQRGEISPEDIDEKLITENLYTAEAPPVDLIIRPSGELRLSNFLIWQAAYAEYYFTDILWPDFKPEDLEKAVKSFSDRNRRFGGV